MTEKMIIRSFMAALIDKVGGYDAARTVISARLGHDVSKGSISKRQAGHLDWPLVEIMALEDAAGDRCVRRWLAQSLPEVEDAHCLTQSAGDLTVEASEAVRAILQLSTGNGCRAEAHKQISDVIASAQRTASILRQEDG